MVSVNNFSYTSYGQAEWKRDFNFTIESVPPLSSEIHTILKQPDPWDPAKKIEETFDLFLVPDEVTLENGEKLAVTVENIVMLAQKKIFVSESVKNVYEKKVMKSHWVLMRKKVIPASRNICFADQEALLKETGCKVPSTLDVIVRELINNIRSGKGEFREEEATYTRCQETIEVGEYKKVTRILVGGQMKSDFKIINSSDFKSTCFGLSPAIVP